MGLTIAYLAQGRLYLMASDQPAKEIESQFVERAKERERRTIERHGWKAGAGEAPELFSSRLLWRTTPPKSIVRMQIQAVAPGMGNEIIFALDTDSIGGLFAHDPSDNSERRLFHKAGFNAKYLKKHPTKDLVALSVRNNILDAHIALTNTAGHNVREVTEGDSVDESPSWVPGEHDKLVFQSAGIARDQAGHPSALGPYRIEELDLDSNKISTLVEEDKYDHLNPRVDSEGALYFIRRPWTPHALPFSPWRMLLDLVLFPFRLARAFVYFFNVFSMAFSHKPLLTAGGPEQSPKKITSLVLWGKMVDAEKAMKAAHEGNHVSLVPNTWQLVKRKAQDEAVIARGVLSFDLVEDGSLIYSNGSAIFQRFPDGRIEQLATGKLIEQVTVIGV